MAITRDILVYFFAFLVVCAGAVGLYDDVANSASGNASGETGARAGILNPLSDPFPGVRRLRLVLMGTDCSEERGRSDTLMVFWLNPQKKRAAIMSLPRDLRVSIPGHGRDKINHAYFFGGADLTVATVENLLGISVHGYGKIDFEGFVRAVDALGGVEIDVEDIEGRGRGMNYSDNWGNLHIRLKPGLQVLDGKDAMGYVRYRKSMYRGLGDSDFGRAMRQQKFLRAVMEQKLRVSNLPALLKAGKEIWNYMETTLDWREAVDLLRVLREMDTADILTVTIPVVDAPAGGVYYCAVRENAFRDMMAQIDRHLDGTFVGECSVQVLNGSGVRGAAGKVAAKLQDSGFTVDDIGNADGHDFDATRIRHIRGFEEAASQIRTTLGGGILEELQSAQLPAGKQDIQISIIVGKDVQTTLNTEISSAE